MARRSRSRTANANGRARSHYSIANPRLLLPSVKFRPVDLRVFEDRRLYDPTSVTHFPNRRRAGGSLPSSVVVDKPGRKPGVSFVAPKAVLVCVRRKQRREVLFAGRKTGKGARSPKRRNEWSNVKCRS